MAKERAAGDYSYDCRWDLADEAKRNTSEGFKAFREGITAGLSEEGVAKEVRRRSLRMGTRTGARRGTP